MTYDRGNFVMNINFLNKFYQVSLYRNVMETYLCVVWQYIAGSLQNESNSCLYSSILTPRKCIWHATSSIAG